MLIITMHKSKQTLLGAGLPVQVFFQHARKQFSVQDVTSEVDAGAHAFTSHTMGALRMFSLRQL